MEEKFRKIIEDVKKRARELRYNGRRCCANQILHVATYLEKRLGDLHLKKEEEKE